ncbi:MAG: serine/threonine-protein kinase [Polyangiaceae bacterium]
MHELDRPCIIAGKLSALGKAPKEVAAGEMLGGRYRVEDKLGAGGMGAVYLATDVPSGQKVAVKVLHDDDIRGPQAQRLMREARVCMAIQHPSLVRVFGLDQRDEHTLYIVMEYLPGFTVSQHLKTRGAFAPDDAVTIAQSVLSALGAIHGHGFFHRDVKGSNVLLVNGDPRSAKLLDLGIAKAAEQGTSLTAEGMWAGTLTAMAPELFDGVRFDVRSEIYSVGLLLYVMLEASAPFPRDHLPTRLRAMELGPRLPGKRMSASLWGVICRALSRDPAKRYQTAIAMNDALGTAMLDRQLVVIGAGDGAPTDLMPPLQMPGASGAGRAEDFSIDETDRDRGPGLPFSADPNRPPSISSSDDVPTRMGYGAQPGPDAVGQSVTLQVAMRQGVGSPSAQPNAPSLPAHFGADGGALGTASGPASAPTSTESSRMKRTGPSLHVVQRRNLRWLSLTIGLVSGLLVGGIAIYVLWRALH